MLLLLPPCHWLAARSLASEDRLTQPGEGETGQQPASYPKEGESGEASQRVDRARAHAFRMRARPFSDLGAAHQLVAFSVRSTATATARPARKLTT